MSNEPIFEKLAREFAARGKSYERMVAPFMAPVKPTLPKRNLAQIIQLPKPDSEFTKNFQNSIQQMGDTIRSSVPKMPMILGPGITYSERDAIDTSGIHEALTLTGSQVAEEMTKKALEPKTKLLEKGLAERQLELYRGISKVPVIVDEMSRYEETGELDDTVSFYSSDAKVGIPAPVIPVRPKETDDVIYMPRKGVKLEKKISSDEILEGKTPTDVIQELGEEFARKHPNAEVSDVFVVDQIDGDKIVTVHGMEVEQTDESVNAASNEETDEDTPVILAPNFWKMSDEE